MTLPTQSTAINPDLDWSQVHETIVMLNLTVARIENAMIEGNDSIDKLTTSFTVMVENMHAIEAAANSLPDSEGKADILNNTGDATEKVQTTIIAFQFYDKLTQRLAHASKSLSALSSLVADRSRLYSPFEWEQLQNLIRSQYTLDSDRKMLEAILQGKSIEEALSETPLQKKQPPDGDIELF